MATVTRGARTTQTKSATAPARPVNVLQEKIAAEKDVEQPVVFVSTLGKDGAFVSSPEPKHDQSTGRFIGMDNGVYVRFTNGISDPYYMSNPIHRKQVEVIRSKIEENWPVVHDLGLQELKPGSPPPPLKRWDAIDLESIKIALTANFVEELDKNLALIEAGARYELSKDKPRKDVVQMLEGLRLQVSAEGGSDADALDVEV